jgi:hypothetical protein
MCTIFRSKDFKGSCTLEDLSIYEKIINIDITETVWKYVNWFQLIHHMKWGEIFEKFLS